MELFLDQHNYMSGALTEKAGIRIAVHNAYVYPLVDDFGLDVEPGTATSIAIQLVQQWYSSYFAAFLRPQWTLVGFFYLRTVV